MDDEIEDTQDSTADEVAEDSGIDVSVYEAKIAELSEAVNTHLKTIATLKGQNYDLLTAQSRTAADDTGIIADAEDAPDDVTIDDLFTTKDEN